MQKQTTLANELWPLLLPRINKLLAGSPAGGAGGSGAVAEHELGGAKHTGVLRTDQAPWAVTDTELSAHAGDPDAHHDRQHLLANASGLGPDHTVSGASAGWVLRATASNAARFMALSHNDLGGVTEDQHHAR